LNGADPGLVSGDEGEADLDVEWSGAVAPKATIKFVVSESELTDAVDGVDASAVYIVDNNVAPVMSESFGLCEAANGTAGNAFQNALWQQAAAEGITVSVSSGDNGSAGATTRTALAVQRTVSLLVGPLQLHLTWPSAGRILTSLALSPHSGILQPEEQRQRLLQLRPLKATSRKFHGTIPVPRLV